MKNGSIVIVCFLICFLMLMIPNITAIAYRTINRETPTYEPDLDEQELKDAIIERIEQLKGQQKEISILKLDWTDPDGPFEGGLDDYTDIGALFFGIFWSGYLLYGIKIGVLRNSENILDFVDGLIYYGACSSTVLMYLGEAFDVFDGIALDGR